MVTLHHTYYHYSCSPSVSAVGSTRREGGVPAYINLSASSMLMIAMQYTSNPVYHCQLLECLMKHKQEVWKVCHHWQQLQIKRCSNVLLMYHYCNECFFKKPKPSFTQPRKRKESWDSCKHISVPYAGSPLCYILWPIPSKTSSCADALSLLAQPEATRRHQWI